jgi:hypothetical protein
MKLADVHLSDVGAANLRSRFFILVDRSSDGCWEWRGPRHSSGHGRYLWRTVDGGNGRYVLAHRVSFFLATGELPRYLRCLCGNKLCCKASHWWRKPSQRWQPKPRQAIRGRLRQLPDDEIRRIRLLDSLGSDEDEIGRQVGLTKRQVADVAMGRVRPEAGGRIRSSRFEGIRRYHDRFERDLLSLSMRSDNRRVETAPTSSEPLVRSTVGAQQGSWQPAPGGGFQFQAHERWQGRPHRTRLR